MEPPPVLPPLLVLPEFELIGVEVVMGVDDVFMLFDELVVPALFVLSLPQPKPKAATVSKVRRAKVLRIELSPVTQRVSLLGS
jgi:hypothetical protein